MTAESVKPNPTIRFHLASGRTVDAECDEITEIDQVTDRLRAIPTKVGWVEFGDTAVYSQTVSAVELI